MLIIPRRLRFCVRCPNSKSAPDLEHQQHQPDLADNDGGRPYPGCGKQERRSLREKVTEQGGSQQQAGNDLADHPWLAQAAQQLIGNPRRGDHDDQLQQNMEKQTFCLVDG